MAQHMILPEAESTGSLDLDLRPVVCLHGFYFFLLNIICFRLY